MFDIQLIRLQDLLCLATLEVAIVHAQQMFIPIYQLVLNEHLHRRKCCSRPEKNPHQDIVFCPSVNSPCRLIIAMLALHFPFAVCILPCDVRPLLFR